MTTSSPKQESEITPFKGAPDEFNKVIASKSGLVVVVFWGQWCGPCRRLTGMLPQVAAENKDVSFFKVDVDENPELAQYFDIIGIPYIILFKGATNDKPTKVAELLGLDNAELRKAISNFK